MNLDEAASILAQDWRRTGIVGGDLILVHSSISRTLRRLTNMGCSPSPEIVVESLLQAVGPTGTVLFPLFNFDFTKGLPFDIRTTPSHMGALTEIARLWEGAVRTGHPIYSFAAIGGAAHEFEGVDNFSGYGENSPFGLLHQMKGKIAVIDLPDLHSMTFYHYIEESLNVPYRYHKTFTAPYLGRDGKYWEKTYGLFVRNIEMGVLTHVDPMGEVLWAKGLYTGERPGVGAGMRLIGAEEIFEACREVITAGKAEGLLYRVDKIENL